MEYLATDMVKPVYIFTVGMVPDKIKDTLPGLYKEFMWNGKPSKIKHSNLISEYSHGGPCDINMKSKTFSSKTLWIGNLKDKANLNGKLYEKNS